MSLFIGTLTDENVREYDYGHCYADDDSGNEFGCGMEYAYYADAQTLEYWHDAVGQVSVRENFMAADVEALERVHGPHMVHD